MAASLDASPFSAVEICAIIKTCFTSGVSVLKLGALQVDFYQVPQLRRTEPAGAQPVDGETSSGMDRPHVVADNGEFSAKAELTDEDKAMLEEVRLAQLMTDSPADYEQEMIDALQN